MPKPSEHKTVQAGILAYAQEIGWTFVPREKADQRRAGFPTRHMQENGGQESPPAIIGGLENPPSFITFLDGATDLLTRHL